MNSIIYNPQEEYDSKFKGLHLENTKKYFDELVSRSKINVEENQATVSEYDHLNEQLVKIKRSYNLWRFLRVVMIITLILIPLVILKITPKIQAMRAEIKEVDKRSDELQAKAYKQMAPLNILFSANDSIRLIESTIPAIRFEPWFSVEQEANMRLNYDFKDGNNSEQSTLDLLAGHYNDNPFLFESKLYHDMREEVYHGYKTITWTETYRGSDGKTQTRMRSETLHASVVKPKPFYNTRATLNYCNQAGDELSFTRDATNLHKKSDKQIERYIKRGERRLDKMTDKAIKENDDFISMSNTDFEVLFDALDRTDEVQFRTLFTPLAQTNMVDLIRSTTGYGDDFHFIKHNRCNRIITEHSQSRSVVLQAIEYASYSFDIIKENFISKNEEYFKAVYFDFAPLWAIPIYQERPASSLREIPETAQNYSYQEYEALLNKMGDRTIAHPMSKTQAIIKASFVSSEGYADRITVNAYSYDIIPRVDYISVHGGDGRWHSVAVPWDDYIPLHESKSFLVSKAEAADREPMARRDELCIYN